MQVYEMVSSQNGAFFLAGAFEKTVQVWDARTNQKMTEMMTHFGAGGIRMCVSDDGRYFAAAAYGRFGVTLYDTAQAKALWTCKEIKRIQRLSFSADHTALYVINGDDMLYTLSLADGSIRLKEKHIEKIRVNAYGTLKADSSHSVLSGDCVIRSERPILDILKTEQDIWFSCVGGGLFCHSADGVLRYQMQNQSNEHYVRLFDAQELDAAAALAYKFDSPRTKPFYFVDLFDVHSGALQYTVPLDDGIAFTCASHPASIISSTGTVFLLRRDGYQQYPHTYDFDN